MNFNEYQQEAHSTAVYLDKVLKKFPQLDDPEIKKLLSVLYSGNGLGEAGEVQNKIKKIIRDDAGLITDKKVDELKGELGGLLWYVAETATVAGLTLSEIAEHNIDELRSRKERNVLHGSGDNR